MRETIDADAEPRKVRHAGDSGGTRGARARSESLSLENLHARRGVRARRNLVYFDGVRRC
jgi:hypothetical protein